MAYHVIMTLFFPRVRAAKIKDNDASTRTGIARCRPGAKHSKLPHSSNVAVIISSCSNDVETLDPNCQRLKDNKRVNPFIIVNRIPEYDCGSYLYSLSIPWCKFSDTSKLCTGMYSID